MVTIDNFLAATYLGNTGQSYLIALGITLGCLLAFYIIKKIAIKRLEHIAQKTAMDIDDFIIAQIKAIHWIFLVLFSVYIGIRVLMFNPQVQDIINNILLFVVTVLVIKQLTGVINYVLKKFSEKNKESASQGILVLLGRFVGIVVWSVGLLFILSNFGINVTSVVAGLGIGGIAIAFAVQNILSDIFSSFAIYFDKPFAEGDFIVVGESVGVVEHIGIKSTRLKALRGELLIISNKEIMSSRIQNFKTLKKRRVVFTIGILYETPVAQVKKVPALVKQVFDAIKDVELDRVHFSEFADSALVFEIVYYVTTSSYVVYRDAQQTINIGIMEQFEKEKIEFAYPTRTIYNK